MADIFSMGVVLYELCCFKHPYGGKDMKELNKNVMKGSYAPIPARYSNELRELCYSMLDNDPQDVVRAFTLACILNQHGVEYEVLLGNFDPGRAV